MNNCMHYVFRLAKCGGDMWGDTCQNNCNCAINASIGILTSRCHQSNGNCYCSNSKFGGPKCDEEAEPCPPGYYNSRGKKSGRCHQCQVSFMFNISPFLLTHDNNCWIMALLSINVYNHFTVYSELPPFLDLFCSIRSET